MRRAGGSGGPGRVGSRLTMRDVGTKPRLWTAAGAKNASPCCLRLQQSEKRRKSGGGCAPPRPDATPPTTRRWPRTAAPQPLQATASQGGPSALPAPRGRRGSCPFRDTCGPVRATGSAAGAPDHSPGLVYKPACPWRAVGPRRPLQARLHVLPLGGPQPPACASAAAGQGLAA